MPIKINKVAFAQELSVNFNLSPDEAEAALLLLDTRAANLDMSLHEYMEAYHPAGFSQRDTGLNDEYKGYVRFLADDAKAIIKTGKTADFSTFVHEQAHIFRRQLAGDLKAKAEKAFKVENGNWSREQEEYFAIGFEEYIRLRMAQSEDLQQVFEKGARCMQHIYNGLDRIVELNPEIIKVYDELFTDSRFHFKQDEFEKTVKIINEGTLEKFKASHVYLGMTPSVYQEIGFERLPVMITARHLKIVMHDWGSDTNVNYHGLTPDIIAQIPEAIKKPLIIMQSQNKEHQEDIIAIVELKDKDNKPIIIPFSPNKKGYVNDIQVDINLAKTIYGKDNFEKFIQRAAQENRILFINGKSQILAIPRVQFPSNQDFQLFYNNIARYQQIVKQKIPGFAKLYQTAYTEESKAALQKYINSNSILFQKSSYYSRETQKEKRAEDINKIAGYFIKAIETNTAPWMKPWKTNEYIDDFNPVTKTTYKGINSMILPFIRETEFHSNDPRWFTFNNAKEQNFMVKKGEKANPVIFYGTVPIGKDGKALEVDEDGNPIGEVERFRPTLRFYKVFHASQLGVPQFDKDGNLLRDESGAIITKPIEPFEFPKTQTIDFKPIERAENVLKKSGAVLYHDQSDRNFYQLKTDTIHLCAKEHYISEEAYYSTALHELTHWTGAKNRLNRDLEIYSLDTEARAREELIAEIGSYALCKDLKLDFNPQNSAAYVQSWCQLLQDKPDEIIKATHAALEAKEFIQNFEHSREINNKMNDLQFQSNLNKGENKMEQKMKGSLLFYEESTGKILRVAATADKYLFDWAVYNSKNDEIVSTFLKNKVNTLFDKNNTTEMNKAADTAMALSGINKLDVYILDDTFEEKIKQYEKHPVMDTKPYTMFEDENLKIVNNRDAKCIQMTFREAPNEKILHDLEFYDWKRSKQNPLCWQRSNTMIAIDSALQSKEKWYRKGYFERQAGLEEEDMNNEKLTNGKKSLRDVGKEIWELTQFSEGNRYGTDFEMWYKECFPYSIHKAAEKIEDGHRNYKDGSFIEMESWEAKDGKPHTFFFDKEHFSEYYAERFRKSLINEIENKALKTTCKNFQFRLQKLCPPDVLEYFPSVVMSSVKLLIEDMNKEEKQHFDKRLQKLGIDTPEKANKIFTKMVQNTITFLPLKSTVGIKLDCERER